MTTLALQGFAVPLFFFFPIETWEQGKKADLTTVSPAMGVGRQPGQASGPGTWKQFQVLYFRHHNRSVMYFYPQVHFEHHVYTNSAGIRPDYLSIYTRKQPEADQPTNSAGDCQMSRI